MKAARHRHPSLPQRRFCATLSLAAGGRLLCLTLALASAEVRADDLSDAFRRAQELVRDWRREPARVPPGNTWTEGAQYSNEAERAAELARQRLAEVEAQLGLLEPATRAYLEQLTSAEDRRTLDALLRSIARLHQDARSQQAELEARLEELRGRLGALRERLRELDLEAEALGSEASELQGDLTQLRAAATGIRGRVATLREVLAELTTLDDGLAEEVSVARTHYWRSVDDLFVRLDAGRPRDYTLPIEAAPATTRRRVLHHSTKPTLIPPIAAPLSPAGPVALPAQPLALPIPALPAPAATAPFEQAVGAWLSAAGGLRQAQRDAEGLLQAVGSTEEAVRERIESLAATRPAVAKTRSEVDEARHEFTELASQLESLHERIPERAARALHRLGESLFWSTAQEALGKILSGATAHAELASHFIWVMRSYTTLLGEDLPTAVELLGPNPSEAALEKFDRLTHLTELMVADREQGLALTQLLRPSEQPSTPAAHAMTGPSEIRALHQRMVDDVAEVLRQKKLGYDPAVKKVRVNEIEEALRIEAELKTHRLIRSEHPGADWVLEDDPKTAIDAIRGDLGPFYSPAELEDALRDHEVKQGLWRIYVVVKTPEAALRRSEIERIVESLPTEVRTRVRVLYP